LFVSIKKFKNPIFRTAILGVMSDEDWLCAAVWDKKIAAAQPKYADVTACVKSNAPCSSQHSHVRCAERAIKWKHVEECMRKGDRTNHDDSRYKYCYNGLCVIATRGSKSETQVVVTAYYEAGGPEDFAIGQGKAERQKMKQQREREREKVPGRNGP